MTKRDLAIKISASTGLIQAETANVIQKVLDNIADELASGHNIELRNFGVFKVQVSKSRKGRNPNKPEDDVVIPERFVVKFRAGKELKSLVEAIDSKKVV